jgi:hypothetical protein
MTRALLTQALEALEEAWVADKVTDDVVARHDAAITAIREYLASSEHIGTHADDCWKWGPQHYECAIRHIKEMTEDWSKHD